MKKLYLLLLSLFALGIGQESVAQNIPEATSLADATDVYIKNSRSNYYVSARTAGFSFLQTAETPDLNCVFRFVKTGDNAYKIFNVGRNKWVNSPWAGTYADTQAAATVWYTGNVSGDLFSLRNSEATNTQNAWNDNARREVTSWYPTDAGSYWSVEEVNATATITNYRPTKRLTSLETGKDIMILNTAYSGTTPRTGFLRAGALNNGSSVLLGYANVTTSPLQYAEGTSYHLFTLEESTTSGKYYIKCKTTGKYVGVNGSLNNATGVDLTIEEFSQATAKSSVNSLNDDGSVTESENITSDNHVWMISNGETTIWNGNPNAFTTWTSGHPYAFYEVEAVQTTLAAQAATKLEAATTTMQQYASVRGKVGAPTEATYAAVEAANNEEDKTTAAFFTKASAAVSAVGSLDIKMPEEGKAYVVISVTNPSRSDADAFISISEAGVPSLSTGTNYTNAAKFVVRKLADGRYVLANGRYNYNLQFYGNGEHSLTVGYDADYSPITIGSMDATKAQVKLVVRRSASIASSAIIVNKTTQMFDKIGGDTWADSNPQQFSIRFRLEEVDYPASATLRSADDIEDVTAMATWSAPYATVVPEDATAYYVSSNGTVAKLTAVEGAIPANQGVILVGEAGAMNMKPAAGEDIATLEGNFLGSTAGEARPIEVGSFVLSQQNGKTAFYKPSSYANALAANRAYLMPSTNGGGSREIVFGFGDNTTAIQNLLDATQQNQPTYDLSGRTVDAKRQGLYIRGGKKFIVR